MDQGSLPTWLDASPNEEASPASGTPVIVLMRVAAV